MNNNELIRPLLCTTVAEELHPSYGLGRPYSQDFCQSVMFMHLNTPDKLLSPHIIVQQQAKTFPSKRTINHWIRRLNWLGHVRPYRKTGNKRAEREIQNEDLVELSLYCAVLPKAFLYEVRAHLFNRNPEMGTPYSNSQVHCAEKKLNLTRKAASTTAYKAYLPRNLLLREMYFNSNYPLGIANVRIRDIIDTDEMGLFLESLNRSFGKTPQGERCDDRGAFENCAPKLNVLAGICGDPDVPMRWIETWTGEGTTVIRYHSFIRRICIELNEHFPGRSFCFTMDNLNSHKNPLVIQEIFEHGHRVVFRAPYWSCDGAIEYVFNTMHTKILSFDLIQTLDELDLCAQDIFHRIPSFTEYFRHVGFV